MMKKKTIYTTLVFAFLAANTAFADLKVYSNDNQYLGYLIDVQGPFIYNDQIQGTYMTYDDGSSESLRIANVALLFESENCTGVPYLHAMGVLLISRASNKFYKARNNEIKQITSNSFLSCNPSDDICSCVVDHRVVKCVEANEISLPFSHPIQKPLRIEHEASGNAKTVVIPLMN
jgi:hypothetical protein